MANGDDDALPTRAKGDDDALPTRAKGDDDALPTPAKGDDDALPTRDDFGRGCYRRAIVLEADGREVRGELADDFHHFAVRLRHDGERTVEVHGEDVRVPWTTCPGAVAPLRRMEGAPLGASLPALLRHTDARAQCTHLHDLACLAVAHGARHEAGGAPRRRYDVAVPDRRAGATEARLERDGVLVASWTLRGAALEAATPAALEGMPLRGAAFHRFLRGLADAELAEAVWVLQRAVFIAMGRQWDFDRMEGAWRFADLVGASCHTFDPARLAEARRVRGTVRDFSDAPERVLDRSGDG
jgi:hypothetical protein